MSLIAGSYERFIWGFNLKSLIINSSETLTQTLTPIFSFPSHTAPIKSLTVAGAVAASGAGDDTIKLYDLSSSSEIGSLTDHSASVTALSFLSLNSLSTRPRNLVSGADDGHVCIFECDPFVHLKTVRAHKKGVADVAVHPSGRLALTVGRDGCLAMVNLVRGRRSVYVRLEREASMVKYNRDGDRFFMCMDKKLSVHEAEDARVVLEFDNEKRVLCAAPGNNGLIFTGGEDRGIKAWDTRSGEIAYSLENAHSARVKGIVVLSATDESEPYTVASASSDGVIRVWDLRITNNDRPNPLAEACTQSRLTCLAGSTLKSFRRPKLENGATLEEQGVKRVEIVKH